MILGQLKMGEHQAKCRALILPSYNDKHAKISPQKSKQFLVAFFLRFSHYHQHGSLFSVVVLAMW